MIDFDTILNKRGLIFEDGIFTMGSGRVTVDPITASYDQILATSPTVPVLFRLTSYRGQQVLFQDAACTIPVESIGDPIGGVRHPLTGEIIAVQTTDANRPVWGGEDVGAVFDGAGDELLTVGTDSNAEPFSIAACVAARGTAGDFLWGYTPSRAAMRTTSNGSSFNTRYIGATSGVSLAATNKEDFAVLFGLYGTNATATEFGVRYRGVENFLDESTLPDAQSELYIGSAGGSGFRDMDCRFLCFYQRILSTEEREMMEALL